jgi:hypothetical protein
VRVAVGSPHTVRHVTVREPGAAVYWAATPDGKMVAFLGEHGIELWDIGAQKQLRVVAETATNAQLLGFSRDGSSLAIWDSGVTRVVDAKSGSITTLGSAHPSPSAGVVDDEPDAVITAAGVMTAVTTGDAVVVDRFLLDRSAARARICAVAGRNLTKAEWSRYVPDAPYRQLCPQWRAPTR